MHLQAVGQMDRLFCPYLDGGGLDRWLKHADGHKVSSGEILVFDEIEGESDFEFVAELDYGAVAEISLCECCHVYIYLFDLLHLHKVLHRSGLLQHNQHPLGEALQVEEIVFPLLIL